MPSGSAIIFWKEWRNSVDTNVAFLKIWFSKIELLKFKDEALGLGLFMVSASFFDALVQDPALPFYDHLSSAVLRRFLVGLAMGLTAFYIFTARFGKQSGAYINPAVTIVRWQLGDINGRDAAGYILFQLAGGAAGMFLMVWLFPEWMRHPAIHFITTLPGNPGIGIAFIAEFSISALLIWVVLVTERLRRWKLYTPALVSLLITLYITFESPLSGMSMNPARTFASAIVSGNWKVFWLYCLAPVSGMFFGRFLVHRPNGKNGHTIAGRPAA